MAKVEEKKEVKSEVKAEVKKPTGINPVAPGVQSGVIKSSLTNHYKYHKD